MVSIMSIGGVGRRLVRLPASPTTMSTSGEPAEDHVVRLQVVHRFRDRRGRRRDGRIRMSMTILLVERREAAR